MRMDGWVEIWGAEVFQGVFVYSVFGFDVTFHVEVAGVVISMREIRMGVSQCESGSGRVGDGGERRGWERRYGGEIGHMEGVAYGAFRFLKPTTRKEVINWESGRRGGREGTDDELLRDERGRDEVKRDEPIVRGQKAGRNADGDRERKEIIMRTWRSRDNRKGQYHLRHHKFVEEHADRITSKQKSSAQ